MGERPETFPSQPKPTSPAGESLGRPRPSPSAPCNRYCALQCGLQGQEKALRNAHKRLISLLHWRGFRALCQDSTPDIPAASRRGLTAVAVALAAARRAARPRRTGAGRRPELEARREAVRAERGQGQEGRPDHRDLEVQLPDRSAHRGGGGAADPRGRRPGRARSGRGRARGRAARPEDPPRATRSDREGPRGPPRRHLQGRRADARCPSSSSPTATTTRSAATSTCSGSRIRTPRSSAGSASSATTPPPPSSASARPATRSPPRRPSSSAPARSSSRARRSSTPPATAARKR